MYHIVQGKEDMGWSGSWNGDPPADEPVYDN
jgi:hypothetical protein